MRFIVYLLFFIAKGSLLVFAQNGGQYAFQFLDLSPSPYLTALGGSQPSYAGNNPANVLANPALLNEAQHSSLSLNTMAYYAGINAGYVGYAQHFDSLATFGLGIQYVAYGSMDETDIYGQTIGTFNSGDYAFYASAAKAFGKWSVGANLKFIMSNLANYNASGIAGDIGVAYSDTASRFQMGLTLKNIGTQLSSYNGNNEPLPFDLQFGVSARLKYLPLRFFATANKLYKWDIRYDDPNITQSNSLIEEDTIAKNYFFDNLFRHFVFGTELYLGKALALQVGYNFLRKQELSLANTRSLVGFSFGFALNIKRVSVNYSLATLHQAGAAHHFGLNMRLGKNKLE